MWMRTRAAFSTTRADLEKAFPKGRELGPGEKEVLGLWIEQTEGAKF